MLPGVLAQDLAIDVRREVSLEVVMACPVAGHRDERHQAPVGEQENDDSGQGAALSAEKEHEGRNQEAHRDALEDARDAHVRAVEKRDRKSVDAEADREDDGGAAQRVENEPAPAGGFCRAAAEGKRHRHADDEEKERKDRVRVGPAVPLGVQERRVGVVPGAGVVDDDHAGDRQAAEDVESKKTFHCVGEGFPLTPSLSRRERTKA